MLVLLLLLPATWAALNASTLPKTVLEIVAWAPVALALTGAAVCLWFHRANPVFALALVPVFHEFLPTATADQKAATLFILPILWLYFALSEERGLLTRWGAMKAGAIVLGLILLTLMNSGFYPSLFGTENWDALLESLRSPPTWTYSIHLPALAVFVFVLGMIALTVRLMKRGRPMDAGYLGGFLALAGAAIQRPPSSGADIFTALAAIILIFALLQESYRMAFLDELTELPGRRALFGDTKKLGKRYCVGMVDVDHFKSFNDTWGHDIGDQVLRMVAGRLQQVTGGGKAYRYGGEEFTVLFPSQDIETAFKHLDQLRQSIADRPFVIRSPDRPTELAGRKTQKQVRGQSTGNTQKTAITVSIGVAARRYKHEEFDDVMKRSDKALYKAKKAGRNRVARG